MRRNQSWRSEGAGVWLACLWLFVSLGADAAMSPDHAKQMAAGLEMFKQTVGPLLKESCVNCHGGEKTKGEFDLTTRESLLKGGTDGVDVVAGDSKKSKLIKLLRHEEDPHMPKKQPQLAADAIAAIAAWIDAGAPYDKPLLDKKQAKDRSVVAEQDRQFWSFQPLKRLALPPSRNPIDGFILAKLEEKHLKSNPPLDKRKLIRRVYFDLIGLPPTPEEIEAFLKDKSPRAYEKLIDRLLASPHYGERWGRHWLDLARFGESHGYEQDYDRPHAYQYRDFVIQALNSDLPYDKFVKWQIAGDELAPDNPLAWKATGYLGAGTHATQITANQAEKERYDELDDMAGTIGTSLLGLTIGCARCHDHKFDPIPTTDYYRLISTFTTTVRSDYDIEVNAAATRKARAAFDREHAPLVTVLQKFEKEKLPARVEQWLTTSPQLPQPQWLTLQADKLAITGSYFGVTKNDRQPDGSYFVTVVAGSPDTYVFTAKTTLTNITTVRLEALADKSLPSYGPGWSQSGDFKLSEFSVTAVPLKGSTNAVALKLASRRATTDKKTSGQDWSLGKLTGRDHALAFQFEKPAGFAEGTQLAITLKFGGNIDRQNIGRFRLAVSAAAAPALEAEAFPLKDFLAARKAFGTSARSDAISKLYCTTDAEWRKLNAAVQAHQRKEPRPQFVKAMVCSEGLPAIRLHTQGPDFYDKTYVLKRGDLAQKQVEAEPSFLQVLVRAPEKEKRWLSEPPKGARTPFRRAAMANWITDVDNGAGNLLARVIVNRLWQHHFGQGIVATPSDFGSQGARPTHPELLDWLAGELIKNGWRLKPIHKLIMMSAVYQQDDRVDETRMKLDPDNTLLWHRQRQRLDAEIVRDAILAVSGRLDPTMLGAGTLDDGMTRRSIYFTIKRSKLIPMMVQFDWPDSLQSLGRRVNTTVAPQALLLMNNPHVRECAVAFAKRLLPKSPTDAVQAAYAIALGRVPDSAELADALDFLKQQTASYTTPDAQELALADFCQTVFALNEFVYVE